MQVPQKKRGTCMFFSFLEHARLFQGVDGSLIGYKNQKRPRYYDKCFHYFLLKALVSLFVGDIGDT